MTDETTAPVAIPPHIEAAFNAAGEAMLELSELLDLSGQFIIALDTRFGGVQAHVPKSAATKPTGAEALREVVALHEQKKNEPPKLTAAEALDAVKAIIAEGLDPAETQRRVDALNV